jgi:hypothetical protein
MVLFRLTFVPCVTFLILKRIIIMIITNVNIKGKNPLLLLDNTNELEQMHI